MESHSTVAAYYNENDPKTAAWLRELITAGLIADGEVDTRSIVDVQASDLLGFAQCHFFAGIGGWSYALRLAGWPDERECWTGSCPCQPFSSAGAQAGGHDSRDLWPAWFKLIAQCRPRVVFGEQVESAIRHGWLDRLCDDLEAEDYAIGPVGLPSACVGAFDIRQRLWFVADAEHTDRRAGRHSAGAVAGEASTDESRKPSTRRAAHAARRCGAACELADTDGERHPRERVLLRPEAGGRIAAHVSEVARRGAVGELGHTEGGRWARKRVHADRESPLGDPKATPDFWADAEWIACIDGKSRPVEPGTFPLAHGLPARMGRLRGYGNAINPWVAAEVIRAYMEIVNAEADTVTVDRMTTDGERG